MKNKTKYIQYIPFVLLFLLASCFDDKGNYDYVDIKDAIVDIPEVTENNGLLSRDRYSDLKLNPEIKYNAGGTANEYDFEWSIFLQRSVADKEDKYEPKKVIGNSPELSYHLVEAPANYYVVLRIIHKETKAETDYRFKLIINSMKGWVVYDENAAGEGDLQIIRDPEIVPGSTVDQKGVIRNYFSLSNAGKKLQGGQFLSWRNMNDKYDHLFLFQKDGMVKMQAGTYEVVSEDYSTLFYTQPAMNVPMAHYYPNPGYGYREILINNNEVYVIKWNTLGQVDKFSSPLAVWGVPLKVNPFIAPIPAVSGNTNSAALFDDIDNPKGQFITINTGGSFAYPPAPGGAFDPQAINADEKTQLRLNYLGQGRDGLTCAVFKDELNANQPWLYVADFRVAASPLALNKYDLSSLENIHQAKLFAFGTRGDVLFYATDHEVYSCIFGGSATRLLLKGGEKIVSMKLYTHSSNEDFNGRILFVATYDGKAGKIYKIKFNELNGQPEGEVEEYIGFGKVVDMIVKE